MKIEDLKLSPYTEECARRLLERFPFVVFTSGRRDLDSQSRAMAENIIRSGNRQWIKDTYRQGHWIQLAVDRNPDATTAEALAGVIRQRFRELDEAEVMQISAHLTGDAFDIRPLVDREVPTQEGWDVINFIKTFDGAKMLLKEGGMIVWHVQFPRSAEV